MNGVTPDPTDAARRTDAAHDGSHDALDRLKLTQALQRAKYAIAWELAWPHLARLLTVVGLFLVVSWAGLWLALPSVARAIGLGEKTFVECKLAQIVGRSRLTAAIALSRDADAIEGEFAHVGEELFGHRAQLERSNDNQPDCCAKRSQRSDNCRSSLTWPVRSRI